MNETETTVTPTTAPVEMPKAEPKKAKAAKPKASKAKAKPERVHAKKVKPAFEPRLPQVRILKALASQADPMPRAKAIKLAGFTPTSGTVSVALNGRKAAGVTGLIPVGAVEWITVKSDDVSEDFLKITPKGKAILKAALNGTTKLPKHRDRDASVNRRYLKKGKGKK